MTVLDLLVDLGTRHHTYYGDQRGDGDNLRSQFAGRDGDGRGCGCGYIYNGEGTGDNYGKDYGGGYGYVEGNGESAG